MTILDSEPSAHLSSTTANVFILSAPSGAGKTTLRRAVLDRFADIHYSVSFTTRPQRVGEVGGRDYHFISTAEFEEGIRSGRWAECARVHENYYGTSAEVLEQTLAAGRDILLDIDVQGARQILRRFPRSVTIFILPPSLEILEARLRAQARTRRMPSKSGFEMQSERWPRKSATGM